MARRGYINRRHHMHYYLPEHLKPQHAPAANNNRHDTLRDEALFNQSFNHNLRFTKARASLLNISLGVLGFWGFGVLSIKGIPRWP